MKIISEQPEFTFDDVLLLPQNSNFSINDESRNVSIKTKLSKNIELDIPIISSPMPGVTEDEMAIAIGKIGGIGFIHHFQNQDRQAEQIKNAKLQKVKVAGCISDLDENVYSRIEKILKAGADLISIETAHAQNSKTLSLIEKIKKKHPNVDLSVSLVVTAEATKAVIEAGADSVRVGIGGGSHCTTRLVTGIGRPQLSALFECSKIAKKYKVPIISDTGIKYSGDIAKAIAFGANSVMIGGLFAGTIESPGKIIKKNGKKYKITWGMCTNTAMQQEQFSTTAFDKQQDFISFLRSQKNLIKSIFNKQNFQQKLFEEGVEKMILEKGSVVPIIENLKNGLMRSMWYLGAHNLKEIEKKTKVVFTSSNTGLENIPRI